MATDCIFCRIVSREIPAREVARNSHAVAFHDQNPQAPVHVLVVPTVHAATAAELIDKEDGGAHMGELIDMAVRVAGELGLAKNGYRMVINTGEEGGQTVDHLHVHLLGGRKMTWPPG